MLFAAHLTAPKFPHCISEQVSGLDKNTMVGEDILTMIKAPLIPHEINILVIMPCFLANLTWPFPFSGKRPLARAHGDV